MLVVRFLETIPQYNGMSSALFTMQRNDEFLGFDVHLRLVGGVLHLCIGTWSASNTCARADAPLNTWIQIAYTYHPIASPRHRIRVEYTTSSGERFSAAKLPKVRGFKGILGPYRRNQGVFSG